MAASSFSSLANGRLASNCRFLATAASPAAASITKQGAIRPVSVEIGKMDNGLVVAAVDAHIPLASVGVVVKSGSRNENYEEMGLNHMLKMASGLATKSHTAFSIKRNLQQIGSDLNCTVGREYTYYSSQFLNEHLDDGMDFFLPAIAGQRFTRWELLDNAKRMQFELDGLSNCEKAIDLLHKAAYRSGLGNSVYSPQHKVGKFRQDVMKSFYDDNFTAERTALIGIGVSLAQLQKYAPMLDFPSGAGRASDKSKFNKGEIRQESGGKKTTVCIGAETPGANDRKGLVAGILLAHIFGKQPHQKRGYGAGILQRSLKNESNRNEIRVESFHKMYTDSSMIGATIECPADQAGTVISTVAKALRGASVTQEQVSAAKKCLMTEMLGNLDSPLFKIQGIGSQLIYFGEVIPDNTWPSIIDAVSLADVQAVAKQVGTTPNLAMSAVGNLSTTPYLDSIV